MNHEEYLERKNTGCFDFDEDIPGVSLARAFQEVDDLADYLQTHPHTRYIYLGGAEVKFVHCLLRFILTQEDNTEEDLHNITVYALRYGHVSLLQELPADYDLYADGYFTSAIIEGVATRGFCDLLDYLLQHKDLVKKTELTAHLLYSTCRNKKIDVVQRLVTAGVNPNIAAEGERVPILEAVRDCPLSFLHTLVMHGADLRLLADEIWELAVTRRDIQVLQFLRDMNIPPPLDIIYDTLVKVSLRVPLGIRIEARTLAKLYVIFIILRSGGARDPVCMHGIHLTPAQRNFLRL